MTLHFAASDTHTAVYVVAGDERRARAWIRRQAQPVRYRFLDYHMFNVLQLPLDGEVVALMGTLPTLARTALRNTARTDGVVLREIYG